jgi:hypothetical protein
MRIVAIDAVSYFAFAYLCIGLPGVMGFGVRDLVRSDDRPGG